MVEGENMVNSVMSMFDGMCGKSIFLEEYE